MPGKKGNSKKKISKINSKTNRKSNNEIDNKNKRAGKPSSEKGYIKPGLPFHLLIASLSQLKAYLDSFFKAERIYIDYHLLMDTGLREQLTAIADSDTEICCALPYMLRNEDKLKGYAIIDRIADSYGDILKGFLVRNLEELGYLTEKGTELKLVADHCIYSWNHASAAFLSADLSVSEITVPLELNSHEIADLLKGIRTTNAENREGELPVSLCIYGRIPMMVSAGCVKKTADKCSGLTGENNTEYSYITDRKRNRMPVLCDCQSCLNVIYNSVPLSLHKQMGDIDRLKGITALRIDLTNESGAETAAVLRFFGGKAGGDEAPCKDYTTGHFRRGTM
ncbi:hypothetical protein [Butyrivibrio sp. MC2013]|uniref:hypothetical protein n=1 Tax=Butyrivibrio sp. MC2013 TaxID=1280686 RepID=UPI0004138B26|nr:hypothetical protein [Butyrivibrio sp. MC2013]